MATEKSANPTLTIIIPIKDYNDLSNGSYELRFTRIDVANTPLGVWAYIPLDGLSKPVPAYEPKNNTDNEVQFEVPLTKLSGAGGDIKYKLSYLKADEKWGANSDKDLPDKVDKDFIKNLFDANDSLAINTIKTRAVYIVEQKSYKIDVGDDIILVPGQSWADKHWTVGFENKFKVLPIILKEEGTTLSAFYHLSWWIKGKGRLSLPQEDNVSIWFANKGEDEAIDVSVEDFSEPKALVLTRGIDYKIKYAQGEWAQQDPAPHAPRVTASAADRSAALKDTDTS